MGSDHFSTAGSFKAAAGAELQCSSVTVGRRTGTGHSRKPHVWITPVVEAPPQALWLASADVAT